MEYTPAQIRTGNRRLLKLADILDKADALHEKNNEPTYYQAKFRHSCGTPACAVGHAVEHAPFKKAGLRMKHNAIQPDVVCRFFALDNYFHVAKDWDELFTGRGCGEARTAKQAAKYIRAFVKRRAA